MLASANRKEIKRRTDVDYYRNSNDAEAYAGFVGLITDIPLLWSLVRSQLVWPQTRTRDVKLKTPETEFSLQVETVVHAECFSSSSVAKHNAQVRVHLDDAGVLADVFHGLRMRPSSL